MKITHYDLFAGIGGFSYALDTIFHEEEIKHIFCEWEAFPTAVLKKHWPDATYYGDIADLVADTASLRQSGQGEYKRPSDTEEDTLKETDTTSGDNTKGLTILTGGFPCQPFSHAGRRKGTNDDRYKWPEMFAVIKNVRPDWVIAENVRGLASWNDGMVLETVCTDLEAEGYEVRPYIIPACSKGAPHRRERVWIIAHTIDGRQRREEQGSDGTSDSLPQEHRSQDGTSRELERTVSNGVSNEYASNTRYQRQEKPEQHTVGSEQLCSGCWNQDWREVAFATCNDLLDDGLPRRLDGATLRGKRTDTISASKHRKEQLKAYGNAIVPQVAMKLFTAIKEAHPK